MHRPSHNRRIVNLNKAQWVKFYYQQQDGIITNRLPAKHTIRGIVIEDDSYALPHHDYPCETALERAIRLDLLDIWEPVCIVQLVANQQLHYTEKKAHAIWAAWNRKIYGTTSNKSTT